MGAEGTVKATYSRKALEAGQGSGCGCRRPGSDIRAKERRPQLSGPSGSLYESEPCRGPVTLLHTEPQPCPPSRPSTHVWFAQDHANLSLPHEDPQCRAGAEPPGTQYSSAERNVLSLLAG